jgi:hypothetical protein
LGCHYRGGCPNFLYSFAFINHRFVEAEAQPPLVLLFVEAARNNTHIYKCLSREAAGIYSHLYK